MKTTSITRTCSCCTGIVLAIGLASAGFAHAETYRQGGSTAIIQQSGGSGTSEARITRYQDGQKIITRDGSSTDITIQRSDRSRSFDHYREGPRFDQDRFFARRFYQDRFSPAVPDNRNRTGCNEAGSSYLREAFRQRMRDRIDSH